MDNIEDIVKGVIRKIAENQPETNDKIDRVWSSVLEDNEQKHTRLSGIKDGTLLVYVDSPTWLYQMKLRRGKLLKMLGEELPEIRDIRFKIGKIQ